MYEAVVVFVVEDADRGEVAGEDGLPQAEGEEEVLQACSLANVVFAVFVVSCP